jgi:hypothetical protein
MRHKLSKKRLLPALGGNMAMDGRAERLQIMLTDQELTAVDDWRFARQMPSRAAAVRELIKRGLSAEGFALANRRMSSKDFGILAKQKSSPDAR